MRKRTAEENNKRYKKLKTLNGGRENKSKKIRNRKMLYGGMERHQEPPYGCYK